MGWQACPRRAELQMPSNVEYFHAMLVVVEVDAKWLDRRRAHATNHAISAVGHVPLTGFEAF